jgi:hypothetical protein
MTNVKKEDWMDNKWRPMMGWTYMVTCIFDFVIAPILWSIIQAVADGQVYSQWQPLTLQGAGLYHIAMGAVLGVTAWSRGQEKMLFTQNTSTTVQEPVLVPRATPVTKPAFVAKPIQEEEKLL